MERPKIPVAALARRASRAGDRGIVSRLCPPTSRTRRSGRRRASTLRRRRNHSPPGGHVRIAVAACGVCGTDRDVNAGFPDMTWPLTPGHEIAGTIAEVGDGVEDFAVGDRVAVGWFGGNCNRCIPCRKGQFMQCERLQVPSLAVPRRLRRVGHRARHGAGANPRRVAFVEAAPMGCAGVTTFNGLRQTRPWRATSSPSSVSADSDISGCSAHGDGLRDGRDRPRRGEGKDAKKLGAHHYIDSTPRTSPAAAGARRRQRGACDGRELRGDGARPSVGSARRASSSPSASRRSLADQPARLITAGLSCQRASVGHLARRRGDDAFRGAIGGAGP